MADRITTNDTNSFEPGSSTSSRCRFLDEIFDSASKGTPVKTEESTMTGFSSGHLSLFVGRTLSEERAADRKCSTTGGAASEELEMLQDFEVEGAECGAPVSTRDRILAFAKESEILSVQVKAIFEESIDAFSKRSELSSVEVEKTYDQIGRLFADNERNGPFNKVEKEILAVQLAWHVAHPGRQEQGSRFTCNVTALRGSLISETPYLFAKMIADVGVNGVYVTADGTTIRPPLRSLKLPPVGSFPPSQGENSWLGQISDQVMVNIFWQRQTTDPLQRAVTKGEIVYEQWPARHGDTGDRLFRVKDNTRIMELTNRNNLYPARHPNLYAGDIGSIYGQITGKDESQRVVGSKLLQAKSGKANFVSSETDLESVLTKEPWPKIVQIHTSQSPFFEDSGNGTAGGAGGHLGCWHVVLVKGYDSKSKQVSVDNSWEPGKDHTEPNRRISLSTFYRAMLGP